jgi:thiamine pyrophosphate-dependent acetolactate synthase large subunit-like protein/site-specific recombinase XerC
MSTVAEQLVHVLLQAGVTRVYGVVGDSLNPFVDAIRRIEGLAWIHVRNEEAGALAAAAEAQLTGRLAVCAGSCGPGNTHLIQGLYDAHRSGVPVLAIASHIPTEQIGTSFFQETHPERLFVECSHYCELVSQASQMPRLARVAIQHAVGRGGVAVLVMPGDVLHRGAEHPTGESAPVAARGTLVPPADQVRALADRLNAAPTVTLFCGAGVRGAHDAVMALADKVASPVGHSLRGKEWIQYDNPYDVGMSGLLGYGACYDATHQADLLVLLGTDFPYDAFLPQRRTVQVDHDLTRFGRRTLLDLAVHGEVAATLDAVLPLVEPKRDRSFLDDMLRAHTRALEQVVDAYTRDIEHHLPIHPEYAANILDEVAAEDAVFTVDTGMCNVWAARYITPNGRRRVIAKRLGLVSENPVTGVPKFRESGQRLVWLHPDDEPTLLAAMPPRLRGAVLIAIHTGLRWSEQAALNWHAIDLLTGYLTVVPPRNTLPGKESQGRHIPLNAVARGVLLEFAMQRTNPDDATTPLFPLSYRWTHQLFAAAVAQAQAMLRAAGRDASRLDGFSWHSLRHSFASRLVMAGVDLRSVAELGGWRTLAMVQRYAHLAPAHLSAAVARLEPAGGAGLGFGLGSADTRRPAPTRPRRVTSR